MAVSSFSIREPATIARIRQEARRAVQERRLAEAQSVDDFKILADDYAKANDELQDRLKQAIEERDRALADLANERLLRRYETATADVEPENEMPPASVYEAYKKAKMTLADRLVFGKDCEHGVADLNENAGPPDKILAWLNILATATDHKNNGTLGKSVVQWLRDQGLRVSGESEIDASNPSERKKRTWDNGDENRYFDKHMKPVEATSPDRCVRIYFEWNEARKRFAVGWIGRHP